jgi:hypothetical protein
MRVGPHPHRWLLHCVARAVPSSGGGAPSWLTMRFEPSPPAPLLPLRVRRVLCCLFVSPFPSPPMPARLDAQLAVRTTAPHPYLPLPFAFVSVLLRSPVSLSLSCSLPSAVSLCTALLLQRPSDFKFPCPFLFLPLLFVNIRLFRTPWLLPGAWLALPDAPWSSVLPAHCGVEPASALCRPAPLWVITVPACLAYLASPTAPRVFLPEPAMARRSRQPTHAPSLPLGDFAV